VFRQWYRAAADQNPIAAGPSNCSPPVARLHRGDHDRARLSGSSRWSTLCTAGSRRRNQSACVPVAWRWKSPGSGSQQQASKHWRSARHEWGYGISGVALAAAACILFARAAHAELAFAGAGAQQCNVVNSNAVPGRGSGQNTVTLMIFSWIQGYMSGFHGFQLLTQDSTSFDLGAVSPAAQWETIASA
jgi:hypothetical protein